MSSEDLPARLRDAWGQRIELDLLLYAAEEIERLRAALNEAKADADERWSEGNYYQAALIEAQAENRALTRTVERLERTTRTH